MLTEIYIEALDEELADQVWASLMAHEIDEATAFLAWWMIVEKAIAAQSQKKYVVGMANDPTRDIHSDND